MLELVSARGEFPAPATFTVANEGSGTLTWSLSESEDWLSAAPATSRLGAGESQSVTVILVDPDLEPGSYGTVIAVEAGSATPPRRCRWT